MEILMLALMLVGLIILPQETHAIDIRERLLVLQDNTMLRYTIAVPEAYDGEQAVPLILGLHYGGWEPDEQSIYYGKGILTRLIEPALADLKAIVIAPDCPGDDWTDPRSVAAVLELLDYTLDRYHIDREKVVVTGYSLGGKGTRHLAANHADRFSAAIPMAAHPPLEMRESFPDIPIYVIHSRADEQVPIGPTETMVATLRQRGRSVEFLIVEEITHHQTIRLREYLRATIPWLKKVWGGG